MKSCEKIRFSVSQRDEVGAGLMWKGVFVVVVVTILLQYCNIVVCCCGCLCDPVGIGGVLVVVVIHGCIHGYSSGYVGVVGGGVSKVVFLLD